jgi:hypothetical protein
MSAKFLEAQKKSEFTAEKKKAVQQVSSTGGGGANPAEVKELKIKLSHKEKEIREL